MTKNYYSPISYKLARKLDLAIQTVWIGAEDGYVHNLQHLKELHEAGATFSTLTSNYIYVTKLGRLFYT